MQERHGVTVGMVVRDADGKTLGKVDRLYDWGFAVVRGLWSPREWIIRYDEVLEAGRGYVSVARSDEALAELAAGALPHSWRQYRPPLAERPLPAAPGEGDVDQEGGLVPSSGRTPDPRASARTTATRAQQEAAAAAHG